MPRARLMVGGVLTPAHCAMSTNPFLPSTVDFIIKTYPSPAPSNPIPDTSTDNEHQGQRAGS